jgi:hypothetical protein
MSNDETQVPHVMQDRLPSKIAERAFPHWFSQAHEPPLHLPGLLFFLSSHIPRRQMRQDFFTENSK